MGAGNTHAAGLNTSTPELTALLLKLFLYNYNIYPTVWKKAQVCPAHNPSPLKYQQSDGHCHRQCHQGVLNPPIICLPMLSLDFTGTNRVQTRPNHGWTRWIVREMKWECLWHRDHFCPSVTSRHSGKSGQWSSREENSIVGVIPCTKKDCCDAGSD